MAKGLGILLIGPDIGFYRSLLAGLAKGFATHGCRVAALSGFASQAGIATWAKAHDIQLVFDLNGMVDPAAPWPTGVLHAKWYHDAGPAKARRATRLGHVDRTYFLFNPHQFAVETREGTDWSILPPAGDFMVKPRPRGSYRCDVSFAGFIPPPVFNIIVATGHDGARISLNEFYRFYPSGLTLQSMYHEAEIEAGMKAVCEKLRCEMTDAGRRLLLNQMIRQRERSEMLKRAIACTNKVDIHGHDNWLHWDIFAPFHRGAIGDPEELNAVYRTSKINLHNGTVSFHFRVIDCMAAGGFMLMLRSMNDEAPGEMRSHFVPGEHYDDFTLDSAEAVIARYLGDDARREKIVDAARDHVARNHSWINRAGDVLRDFGLAGAGPVSDWDPKFTGDPALMRSLEGFEVTAFRAG
jgi:hypothetical protein